MNAILTLSLILPALSQSILDQTYYRFYYFGDGRLFGVYDGRTVATYQLPDYTQGQPVADTKGYATMYRISSNFDLSVFTGSNTTTTLPAWTDNRTIKYQNQIRDLQLDNYNKNQLLVTNPKYSRNRFDLSSSMWLDQGLDLDSNETLELEVTNGTHTFMQLDLSGFISGNQSNYHTNMTFNATLNISTVTANSTTTVEVEIPVTSEIVLFLSIPGDTRRLRTKLVLSGESPSTSTRTIGILLDARWAGPELFALVQETFVTDPPAKLFVRYNFLLDYWEAVGCSGTVWNFESTVWDLSYQGGVTEIAVKTPGSTETTDTIGAYIRVWKSSDATSCWSNVLLPYSWSQISSIRYLKSVLFVAGIRGLEVFPFTTSNYLLERLTTLSAGWYDHANRVDLDTLGPMSRGFWGPSLCLNGLFGEDCSCTVDRITAGQVCSQGSYSVNVGPNPILIYPNPIPIILTNFTSTGGTLIYVVGGGAPPQIEAEGCVNISGAIVLELELNGTSPVVWTLFRSLSNCLNVNDLNVTVDLGDSCYTATAQHFQSRDRLSVAVLFDDSGCDDGLTPLYIGLACAAAGIVIIVIVAAVLRKRWLAKKPQREKKAAARSLDFYDLEEGEEKSSKKRRKQRDSEGSTVALSSIATNSYNGQSNSARSSLPETSSPASESSPVTSHRSSVS